MNNSLITRIWVDADSVTVPYGQPFDKSLVTVRGSLANGIHVTIPSDAWTLSSYDPTAVGTQLVTLSYVRDATTTLTTTFSVRVAPYIATPVSISVSPSRIQFLASKGFCKDKLHVRMKLTDGTMVPLTSSMWTYRDFVETLYDVEQLVTIVFHVSSTQSLTCTCNVTIIDDTMTTPVLTASPLPLNPASTVVMMNVLGRGKAGVYCTGGHDNLPVDSDVKRDGGWTVNFVSASGQTSALSPGQWTVTGFNTSKPGVTRGTIYASVDGASYLCYRAVTIMNTDSPGPTPGEELELTPHKTTYSVGDCIEDSDVDVYYKGKQIHRPAWGALFDSSSPGTVTVTIVYDPDPEIIGHVVTARYTVTVRSSNHALAAVSTKRVYTVNEPFDKSRTKVVYHGPGGMQVLRPDEYIVSGFDSSGASSEDIPVVIMAKGMSAVLNYTEA